MNDSSVDALGIWDKVTNSLEDIVISGVDFIPKLLAALVVVIVGSILASVLAKVVRKAFGVVENNSTVKNILEKANLPQVKLGNLASKAVKWVVLIVFWTVAADVLEMPVLSETINSIVDYLPKIFAAVIVGAIIFVASNVAGDFVKDAAKNAKLSIADTLGTVARVAILMFGIPLAVAQLGLDLSIINNNLTVIVAGIVGAAALAFGLGGREVAGKILDNAYKKYKK